MSLRALRWSRKLLLGKDASALGMQLWLPAQVKETRREKRVIWCVQTSGRFQSVGIICTYMSSGEEKVQIPRSLESLPFLQRTNKQMMLISDPLLRSAYTCLCCESRHKHTTECLLSWEKLCFTKYYCRTKLKLWPFSMSLYNWSIKESNCSLCWAGSSSASQAWTHWLKELELIGKNEHKDRQQRVSNRGGWRRKAFTWCRCLVR